MIKQSVFCAIFFILPVFCGDALAQTNPDFGGKDGRGPCARYSMRVTPPRGGVDYKLQVNKPLEGIDYKAKVTNPCAPLEMRIAEATINKPGSERRTNSISPSLRLPRGLKTPSEILKEYALPAQPKKNR